MAKRRRGACSIKDSKCRDQHSSIDRISILPNELLVFILSFLTLKEAVATSIISRRWRYLWTFIPRLDFDGTKSLLKVDLAKRKQELVLEKERWNYVRWVNHVLALHKDSTIEDLRVFFNLTKTYKRWIDKWIKYALTRKVQRLELNLTDDASIRTRHTDEHYTFPYKLLRRDKGKFSNSSQSWSMRQCNSIDYKYLKKISMNFVNVNGEALEFLLCNCPLLEHLSVSQSGELSTLKITGPLPSFKHLEISFCDNLNSLEIRDANLVYLRYEGSMIHFLLENIPLLVEIFIGGKLTKHMKNVLLLLSSYLPQLEIFTIEALNTFSWEETEMFYSAVKMNNLKQLVLKVDVLDNDSLLPLTNLIRASPCLQKFVLEAFRWPSKFVKRKVKKIESSYGHLKEVEFVGYCGVTSDLELVMHFLENAAALEKILVDPREPWNTPYGYMWKYNCESKCEYIKDEAVARNRAKKQLTKKVPPRINLKIL